MQYSALLVSAEVIAIVVEHAVPVSERSMDKELHPRLVPDSLRADPESADRHEIDIADLCGQFLKHFLPCGDGLISGANEVVQKDHGIVCTKSGSEQIASADEKRIKLPMVQIVREAKLVEHVVAAFARA
jgi:hypothetical protein